MTSLSLGKLKKRSLNEIETKPKKKHDRFDGLSEEEVQKFTLLDYLEHNLDIVFIGINPSLMAAHRGRYYAGPGNHFYKLLHESELVPNFISFDEDHKLLQYGIGLTNIVARATRSAADLKRIEIEEGAKIIREKLLFYKPKIAVFNGKCIYEVYAKLKYNSNFQFGLQLERVGETTIWVVPSSSARCSNFPRMQDKLHFYTGIKKYLKFLRGEIKNINVNEFRFEGKCKQSIPTTSKMWRRKDMSAFLHGGRIANKDTICLDTSEEEVSIVNSTEFVVKELSSKNLDYNSDESIREQINSDIKNLSNEEVNKDTITQEHNATKQETLPQKISLESKDSKKSFMALKSTNTTTDFVNLIKQRILEKSEKQNNLVKEKNIVKPKRIKLA